MFEGFIEIVIRIFRQPQPSTKRHREIPKSTESRAALPRLDEWHTRADITYPGLLLRNLDEVTIMGIHSK